MLKKEKKAEGGANEAKEPEEPEGSFSGMGAKTKKHERG